MEVQNFEQHAMMSQRYNLEFIAPLEKQGLFRKGFKLPASQVIHTVGPVYDTDSNPEGSLRSAYSYPFDEAATIAVSTIKEFANDFKE
ncbi:Macro domain, partial [Dillenia turbinata]